MEEWKIGDKCYIMTKEERPLSCIIHMPHFKVETWILFKYDGYWGPAHESKMFRTKKECLLGAY